jgi:hypothetical protein
MENRAAPGAVPPAESKPVQKEKNSRQKEIAFPFEVVRGSVTVKVYRTPSHGCESFTLLYHAYPVTSQM